jgi:diguanylate cyclase (GGDEF)-like protein/PAS domain S-box-containing protein
MDPSRQHNPQSHEEQLRECEERFHLLLAGVKDYILYFLDTNGNVTAWYENATVGSDAAPEGVIGRHFSHFYPTEESKSGKPQRELAEARLRGSLTREGWQLQPDGSLFWGECVTTPLRDAVGELRGYSRVVRDITERKRTEEALRSVVDHSTDALIIVNQQGIIQSFAGAARRIFGYSASEAVGQNVSLLMPEPWRSQHDTYIQNYITTQVPKVIGIGREVTGLRKDGTPVPLDFTLTEFSLDGQRFFTGIMRDITERKAAQEQLRIQATHDALTGLWNRRAILELLSDELSRGRREGFPVGVVLLDLDHFKQINDTFGHQAGDVVLYSLARDLNGTVRPYDRVGRYGGEEFLIVLPHCNEPGLEVLCERLRISIASLQVMYHGRVITFTASLGATIALPAKETDIDDALHVADLALYRAKSGGRNRVEIGSM